MYPGEESRGGPIHGHVAPVSPLFAPPAQPPASPPMATPSQITEGFATPPTEDINPLLPTPMHTTPVVQERESFLSRATSIPVAACVPLIALGVGYFLWAAPIAVLGFLPLILLAPFLLWLGSLKPDHKPFHLHSFAWGSAVAVVVAGTINTTLSLLFGDIADQFVPLVLSAPISEEIMKGLAVVYAVKQFRSIDSPLDAMIAAGWAAAGFTVIENVLFISAPFDVFDTGIAAGDPNRSAIGIAVIRNFTFFVHTVATAPIGYAIGKAIAANKPLISSWWGWVISIGLHASWNGAIWYQTRTAILLEPSTTAETVLGAILLGIAAALIAYITITVSSRSQALGNLNRGLGWLTNNYRIPTALAPSFSSWANIKLLRGTLRKEERTKVNQIATTFTRLGEIQHDYQKIGPHIHPDRKSEGELVAELNEAFASYTAQSVFDTSPLIEPEIDQAAILNGHLDPAVTYHSSHGAASREILPQGHSFDQHATQGTQPISNQQSSL